MRAIYERITSEIADAIEAGAADYHMPWHTDASFARPANAFSN